MKKVLLFLFIISNFTIMAQDSKAVTVKKTFSRATSISANIDASPETVWALLTNAQDYSRWNSTVISIEGDIKKGEKIKLKSILDPKRTFKLKVKEWEPNRMLKWGDAMGNRIYSLEKKGTGTIFSMTEKIGGLFFPLFASKIPSFDESFEQFTTDLKKEAESK